MATHKNFSQAAVDVVVAVAAVALVTVALL